MFQTGTPAPVVVLADDISGETLKDTYLVKNSACHRCPMACGRVVNVDGTDYDYWQKWDESNESINLGDTGNYGDYVYATTARIVSNPEAYSFETTNETIEITIQLNPKGVIYYMKDEWGNECPYDFKNIQFKHPKDTTTYPDYYYTFSTIIDGVVTDHSILQGYCYGNTMKERVSSGKQSLNNNVFINTSVTSNCYGNSFEYNCFHNTFANRCYNNSFETSCSSNSFGNNCFSNSFGNGCQYNSFGNNSSYNSFGDECHSNSFGDVCLYNTFKDNYQSNSFGNNCSYNTFGIGYKFNSFGNNCHSNFFGNSCQYNSFGNNCSHNSFGNVCSYNSFGNNCSYNSFGNDCSRNSFRNSASQTGTLKDYCEYNHFDDGCNYNVIWNSNTTSSNVKLKNINVNRGVCGTSSSYNYINIETLNSEKELNIRYDSEKQIVVNTTDCGIF